MRFMSTERASAHFTLVAIEALRRTDQHPGVSHPTRDLVLTLSRYAIFCHSQRVGIRARRYGSGMREQIDRGLLTICTHVGDAVCERLEKPDVPQHVPRAITVRRSVLVVERQEPMLGQTNFGRQQMAASEEAQPRTRRHAFRAGLNLCD